MSLPSTHFTRSKILVDKTYLSFSKNTQLSQQQLEFESPLSSFAIKKTYSSHTQNFSKEQAAWRYISNLCILYFFYFLLLCSFFSFPSVSRFFANMRQFSASAPSVLCGVQSCLFIQWYFFRFRVTKKINGKSGLIYLKQKIYEKI